MKEQKIKKKRGNPNWHKGMPAPSPKGRQKGLKDSPYAPRQRQHRSTAFWSNLDACAKRDGFENIESWLWNQAKTDPELGVLLKRIMLEKLSTNEIGGDQYDLSVKGMLRDVQVAQAQASGGNAGNTVLNVVIPPVLAASEDMRQIDRITVIDAEALPMANAGPTAPDEYEEVEADTEEEVVDKGAVTGPGPDYGTTY